MLVILRALSTIRRGGVLKTTRAALGCIAIFSLPAFGYVETFDCTPFPVTFSNGAGGPTSVSCPAFSVPGATLTGVTLSYTADYEFGASSNTVAVVFTPSGPGGVTWSPASTTLTVTGGMSSVTEPPGMASATAGVSAAAFAATFSVNISSSVPAGSVLASAGAVSIAYTYATSTGTIQVTTNLSAATFSLTGPASYSGSGTNVIFDNVPPGTYTIAFGPVTGFALPAQQTQVLAAGGTISFTGDYQSCVTLASIDESNSHGVISAMKTRSGCTFTFTVNNLHSYLWTNIVVTTIGIPPPQPLPGDSALYTQLGVLAPGKSASYDVQFSKPGQSVNVFVDPSAATSINATVANVFQEIIDVISTRYPAAGAVELGIEDVGQVFQAFDKMPDLMAALNAFAHQTCFATFCFSSPEYVAGFRDLAAFATSSTEPQILVNLISQVGIDVTEIVGLTALKLIGTVETAVLEFVTNILTAFSGNAAGSVSLTAQ